MDEKICCPGCGCVTAIQDGYIICDECFCDFFASEGIPESEIHYFEHNTNYNQMIRKEA